MDARENEKAAYINMIKSNIELKRHVKESSTVMQEYKNLVDRIWNKKWNEHKCSSSRKIKWLETKQQVELEKIVQNKNKTSRLQGLNPRTPS